MKISIVLPLHDYLDMEKQPNETVRRFI